MANLNRELRKEYFKKLQDLKESFNEKEKIKVGDKVKIDPLTNDPINKEGQTGKVIKIDKDIVTVEFKDNKVGKYVIEVVDKKESFDKEEIKEDNTMSNSSALHTKKISKKEDRGNNLAHEIQKANPQLNSGDIQKIIEYIHDYK